MTNPPNRGGVVLLAGPGDATDIVANYLASHVADLTVIKERGVSRIKLARGRARRIGFIGAFGQVLFVVATMPWLRWRSQYRRRMIFAQTDLDDTPFLAVTEVSSVNAPETVALIRDLDPAVVVVNGTRIISRTVLDSIACPVINTHAGITPRYRGVHGGYWALVMGHPEEVGTTIHLVDPGIDTGTVLVRAYFETTPLDSIATYPYLHLNAGLPHLAEQVQRALKGEPLMVARDHVADGTHLYTHPTLWGYIAARARFGVR